MTENTAIQHFKVLAKELQVVLPISFYEKMAMSCITQSPSLMLMEKCWASIGRPTYQMTIIIKKSFILRLATLAWVWDTRYAKIGIGICWDQWFPETALSCFEWC